MKKIQSSTEMMVKTKKRVPVKLKKMKDEYFDVMTWRRKPIMPEYVQQIAQELRDWSLDDDALTIDQFINIKGMRNRLLYELATRHDFLRDALDFAIRQIAVRREVGALTNKLNAAVFLKTQGMYCKRFKEYEAWRASLTKDEREPTTLIIKEIKKD